MSSRVIGFVLQASVYVPVCELGRDMDHGAYSGSHKRHTVITRAYAGQSSSLNERLKVYCHVTNFAAKCTRTSDLDLVLILDHTQ